MARRALPIIALVGSIALVAIGLSHVSWRGDRRGSFVVGCLWSHTLRDDPIVWPSAAGASHSHDFFGNVTTNAFSTRASLLQANTTCRNRDDTAAVWSPSAFLAGDQVVPVRERTYYSGAGRRDVRSMPADLKMIAGEASAADPAGNPHVGWFCGGDTPVADHPYDCTPYRGSASSVDGVTAFADFPQCWDAYTSTRRTTVRTSCTGRGGRAPPITRS
jgi:hypothetical protein